MFSFRMCNRYSQISQQSKSDEPTLMILKPIVFKRERYPLEYVFRVNKIQTVHVEILSTLALIPAITYRHTVYATDTSVNAVLRHSGCASPELLH